jgi:carbamate kinase
MVREEGGGLRRAVASPAPRRVLELSTIRRLLEGRLIVICGGGGGIPVVVDPKGALRGVEAVIDKDRSAALLAEGVSADGLLLLTDAPCVFERFGTPRQRPIRIARTADLRGLGLEAGSMGPKVEAACRFVERTGGWAAIGSLEEAGEIVAGKAGTLIEATPMYLSPM